MPSISREYETSSETESESVPIYTPSRGSSHADVLELESSPLLPEDEKSSLCHQGTETSKMGGVSGGEDADAAAGSGGGRGHWCKHRGHSGAFLRTRRRHKHILAIAGLKVLMLAAVLVFFLTTGDWNWKLVCLSVINMVLRIDTDLCLVQLALLASVPPSGTP